MERVGHREPTYLKPQGDAVVATLIRLIASSKAVYREPLLDALFQYRRREGVFIENPKIRGQRWALSPMQRFAVQPIPIRVGSGGSKTDAPAVPNRRGEDTDRRASASSRRSLRPSV